MAPPKIVLVTGCSTGIGLSTAVLLASDKEKRFKVYATLRNLAKKDELYEKGKNFLGETLIVKAMDVCSEDSVHEVLRELLAIHHRVDVLSKFCAHWKAQNVSLTVIVVLIIPLSFKLFLYIEN